MLLTPLSLLGDYSEIFRDKRSNRKGTLTGASYRDVRNHVSDGLENQLTYNFKLLNRS